MIGESQTSTGEPKISHAEVQTSTEQLQKNHRLVTDKSQLSSNKVDMSFRDISVGKTFNKAFPVVSHIYKSTKLNLYESRN